MAKRNTNIQSFNFADGITIRSMLDENNSPWFVAVDICKALEIKNVTDSMKRLDEDEKATLDNTEGRAGNGAQGFNIINESGLYSLILTSRKAEAKRFKKWVTSEVLPAIRKTGGYGEAQPTKATRPALEDKTVNHIWLVMNDSGQVLESIPMRDAATVRGQVDKHFPTVALLERSAVIEDLDHVADLMLELNARVRNTLNPLITTLGTITNATQADADAFWSKRRNKSFQRLAATVGGMV